MDILMKKITQQIGPDEDVSYVFFEQGKFSRPIMIIDAYRLARLFEQFKADQVESGK